MSICITPLIIGFIFVYSMHYRIAASRNVSFFATFPPGIHQPIFFFSFTHRYFPSLFRHITRAYRNISSEYLLILFINNIYLFIVYIKLPRILSCRQSQCQGKEVTKYGGIKCHLILFITYKHLSMNLFNNQNRNSSNTNQNNQNVLLRGTNEQIQQNGLKNMLSYIV